MQLEILGNVVGGSALAARPSRSAENSNVGMILRIRSVRNQRVGPKIRDEVLEDAVTLGEWDFPPILGSATEAGFPPTDCAGNFFPSGLGFLRVSDTDTPVAAHRSGCQEHDRRPDHDVSGMAPPSRMMLAQRSRIAANMSNMAAPICKKICRPWRTILPAV